jgi:hypothetical protein
MLEGKLARSRLERVVLASVDKQEVLKLTQEIRFAIEIAMVSRVWFALVRVANDCLVRRDY